MSSCIYRSAKAGMGLITLYGPIGDGPGSFGTTIEDKDTPLISLTIRKARCTYEDIIITISINVTCCSDGSAEMRIFLAAFKLPTGLLNKS
jgi:hypothetical protein